MNRQSKLLAFLVSVSLALTTVPFPVFAAEETLPPVFAAAEEETGEDSFPDLPDYAKSGWEGVFPTDAPIELLVGGTLPLYELSAQDYLDGKINIKVCGLGAELVTEEGCDYVKLVGLEEGMVDIEATNADGTPYNWYDYGGRKRSILMVYVVKSASDNKTCTNTTGIWLKVGETRQIAFWNSKDMKDEGAVWAEYSGTPNASLELSYEEGSGVITVTALEPGEKRLEIFEKRSDAPCVIRITVGEEEPTEFVPTEATTEPVYPTTTAVNITEPEETLPTTTVDHVDGTGEPAETTATTTMPEEMTTTLTETTTIVYTTYAVSSATSVATTSTKPVTDPTEPAATEKPVETTTDSRCTVTEIKVGNSPMYVGEVRGVQFWDPDTGKADGCRITMYSDNFSCYHEEGSDMVYITALRPGKIELGIRTGTTALDGCVTLDVTADAPQDTKLLTLGNLNTDAGVNAGDATVILEEAARIGNGAALKLSAEQRAAADVNFDGVINTKDATCVLVYAAAKGNDAETPDFPTYLANRRAEGKPVTGDVRCLSQTIDGIYRVLPDDGTWKADPDGAQYGYKYRLFTSETQLADFARYLSENGDDRFTEMREDFRLSELAERYGSRFFAEHDLIAVASREPITDFSYRLEGIDADADNNWTVRMTRIKPMSGGAVVSGYLTLIEVNKEAEKAASLKVTMADEQLDEAVTRRHPNTFYRKGALDFTDTRPVVISGETELAELFPDETKKDWCLQFSDDKKYSAQEAATALYKSAFEYGTLIWVRGLAESGSSDLYVQDYVKNDDGSYTVHIVRRTPETAKMNETDWEFLIYADKDAAGAEIKVEVIDYRLVNPLPVKLDFEAETVRYHDSTLPAETMVFRSRGALTEKLGALGEALDKYDDAFFADKALIVLPRKEPSGSNRLEVQSLIDKGNGQYEVNVAEHVPTMGTDDIGYWYILIGIDKGIPEDADIEALYIRQQAE